MISKLLEILRSQIKLTWLATLEQFENFKDYQDSGWFCSLRYLKNACVAESQVFSCPVKKII